MIDHDSYLSSTQVPEALHPPIRPVRKGFVGALALANLFIWIAVFPAMQLLLPEQVEAIDAANKTLNLDLVTSIGAVLALIANPLARALSDRTTSRLGRRRPWILAGALLTAVALTILRHANSIIALMVGWSLVQCFSNVLQAAVSALVPDRIPTQQRGTITGLVSMTGLVGAILGAVLIGQMARNLENSYFVLTTLPLVFLVPYALFLHEKVLLKNALPPFRLGTFLKQFWINPRVHPDFAWTWLARFVITFGSFSVTGYLYYYLQDVVHYSQLFPGQTVVAQGSVILNSVAIVSMVVSAVAGGWLSARFQRRKLLVLVASAIVALALLLMGLFPSWNMALLAMGLQGFGFGCYLAVDLALVTLVLPSEGDRGKELGIFNIASSLPQSLAPMFAGVILSMTHNSYPVLLVMAALITLVGAFLVQPIKRVR